MKKIFLSLVFLFGVGTFVMADDTMKVKNDTVAVEDGFKCLPTDRYHKRQEKYTSYSVISSH